MLEDGIAWARGRCCVWPACGGGMGICMVWADRSRAAKRAEQAPRARPRKVRRVLIKTPREWMAESTEWDRRDADLLRQKEERD